MAPCDSPNSDCTGKVMKRYISPTVSMRLCSDCAMEARAISNDSGHQARADQPPYSNGSFTA